MIIKNCLNCNKEFNTNVSTSKFCSKSCSATVTNKLRSKKHINICINCGSYVGKNAKKFCSHKCTWDYKDKAIKEQWFSGLISGSGTDNVLKKGFRIWFLESRNYKCEKCNWCEINPVSGIVPVQVHHIDGDYTNNFVYNLSVLCPNCHSLTDTFGKYNKHKITVKRKRGMR